MVRPEFNAFVGADEGSAAIADNERCVVDIDRPEAIVAVIDQYRSAHHRFAFFFAFRLTGLVPEVAGSFDASVSLVIFAKPTGFSSA
jgi:hypothetical protein